MNISLGTTLVLILTTLTCGGCGTSDATSYYSLQPMTGATHPSSFTGSGSHIRVIAIHPPVNLDRIEILRETAPGQFEVNEFEHWAAPFSKLAVEALTEDLDARLPNGMVVFPQDRHALKVSSVSVDMLSYHAIDGNVRVELSWSFLSGSAQDPVWTTEQLTLTAPMNGTSGASRAGALSNIFGQLADRIADRLPTIDATAGSNTSPISR